MEKYAIIASQMKDVASLIRPELKDAYFAAIEYPVLAAEAHARKLLRNSKAAYDEIKKLTDVYNHKVANGKWNGLMDMKPRNLPVFADPNLKLSFAQEKDSLTVHPINKARTIARNASDFQKASGPVEMVQMLGHSMHAVSLPKGESLTYDFSVEKEGDALLKIALIPTQPSDQGDLRFSVCIDGADPTVLSLKEPFRSERWKLNVLRGQAVRDMKLTGLTAGKHTLVIKALDHHVLVDQWMIDSDLSRQFYLFPVE